MKKHWLYYISPLMLAMVFCLIPFILLIGWSFRTSGSNWLALFLTVFLPGCIILLVLDIIVKLLTNDNILHMWITELIMITIVVVWIWNSLN